jgi:hypothetical protein
LIAPEPSFVHYTAVQRLSAVGTVSVTTDEVTSIGLLWRIDPEPFPEHAVIDYSALTSTGRVRAKAQALAERARSRGWTYLHSPA